MGSALDDILTGVREDLAARKAALSERDLRDCCAEAPAVRPFGAALRRPPGAAAPRVIAEVKKASPSRGPIAPGADAAAVAKAYEAAGAAAISVLTEARRFGGSIQDLSRASRAISIPALRKDFVVDPYQIFEAAAFGASAILLIAALYDPPALAALLRCVKECGLEALVEVHDEADLGKAVEAGATVIGVNNRDLATLEVSLATSERLAPLLPKDAVRVSESGIASPADVARVAACGYDAVLVGESLMSAPDPGAALRALLAPEEARVT